MQYIFITTDQQRIKLKVHRKSPDCIEFVEDLGIVQIPSSEWIEDVMNEIACTSGDPRRVMVGLLEDYQRRYPTGFERMPLTRFDVKTLLTFFANMREEARLEGDEDDYWARAEPYDEQSVLQDLETTLAN